MRQTSLHGMKFLKRTTGQVKYKWSNNWQLYAKSGDVPISIRDANEHDIHSIKHKYFSTFEMLAILISGKKRFFFLIT